MEIHKKLDQLSEAVESARTMPMSSTAMVNKSELLSLIDQVRSMLPESISAADTVIAQREQLLEEARVSAGRLVSDAKAEQARLVGDHTILVEARRERGRTLEQTQRELDAMRAALDDHVDAKLAHVELAADRIAGTVRESRAQLQRSTPYDALAAAPTSPPELNGRSERAAAPDENAELDAGGDGGLHVGVDGGGHPGDTERSP